MKKILFILTLVCLNLHLHALDKAWIQNQNKKTALQYSESKSQKDLLARVKTIVQNHNSYTNLVIHNQFLYASRVGQPMNIYRTSIKSFESSKPEWEIVLKAEQYPIKKTNLNHFDVQGDRILVTHSPKANDQHQLFEWNMKEEKLDFFKSDIGIGFVSYVDENSIYIAATALDGKTDSGEDIKLRLWKRGEDFKSSKVIWESEKRDYNIQTFITDGQKNTIAKWFIRDDLTWLSYFDGEKVWEYRLPYDGFFYGVIDEHWILQAYNDVYTDDGVLYAGELAKFSFEAWKKGETQFEKIVEVENFGFPQSVSIVGDDLFLFNLFDSLPKYYILKKHENGYKTIELTTLIDDLYYPISSDEKDKIWLYNMSWTEKEKLLPFSLKDLKIESKWLDAVSKDNPYEVTHHWCESRGQVWVPYTLISKQGLSQTSKSPVLVYVYGGFGASILPMYDPVLLKEWVDKGGRLVFAKVRGGKEYGPNWHYDGSNDNQYNTFYDLASILDALVESGLCNHEQIGIYGYSHGAMVVSVMLSIYPKKFAAAFASNGLYDILNYDKHPLGKTWSTELGDLNDELMRRYIKSYSPYHNVSKDVKYPKLLVVTNQEDDRVLPKDSRRYVKKLLDNEQQVHYFEFSEGGHFHSGDSKSRWENSALMLNFFKKELGLE